MEDHGHTENDYGTGEKTFAVYLFGILTCSVLTLIAFGAVLSAKLGRMENIAIVYSAAIIQFIVQVFCFLRLNGQTPQGKINLVSLVFTIIILISIVGGSLWIMFNLKYLMAA
jgi:cytochrome o ubiquinol oxidase operon protein cyoD